MSNPLDIPRQKNFPANAAQCKRCWGRGCNTCSERGWLTPGEPFFSEFARKCALPKCEVLATPDQLSMYCSPACKSSDVW